MQERMRDIVALFESHGSLVDPALADELAQEADGPVRVQAVLAGLQEIPFHFDGVLWRRLEEQARDAVAPEPVPPPADEAARARKEAMRRAAAAVYDAPARSPSDADAEDADEEHDDLVAPGPAGPAPAGQEAAAFLVAPRGDWRPAAAEYEAQLEMHTDMTGQSTCEGTTGDFVEYFQDRFRRIAKVLRGRRELRAAAPVDRLKPGQQEVQIIGMVVENQSTKNGHRMLEVEDETGAVKCFIRKDETQLLAIAAGLVHDEVVGVVGSASPKGDMVYVASVMRPDIPNPDPDRKRGADVPVMAAFLSDVHVGNRTFLEENWKAMLRWLNGHGGSKREREAAGRVKYLVVPGDLVDGVGVYPGQQNELYLDDIYAQYAAFGSFMQNIPEHVEVVVQPGNHDTAARPAEPQPGFAQDVRENFDHHATHFVSNPAWFSMHGVKTLGYHGSSLVDFAVSMNQLEVSRPLDTMEHMLKMRHLAPIYGKITPLAPEHTDYLVIDDVPDLFVTGHVHVPGFRTYRGVQMVNCGTWQGQTSYQKMLNFTPDPAKMPLVDLQTLRGTLVDFQTPDVDVESG